MSAGDEIEAIDDAHNILHGVEEALAADPSADVRPMLAAAHEAMHRAGGGKPRGDTVASARMSDEEVGEIVALVPSGEWEMMGRSAFSYGPVTENDAADRVVLVYGPVDEAFAVARLLFAAPALLAALRAERALSAELRDARDRISAEADRLRKALAEARGSGVHRERDAALAELRARKDIV